MTPTDTGTEARIDELEVRLAQQDQAVHELGNEVYRQQRLIAQLQSSVQQLAARLGLAEGDQAADPPVEEVPPHY